MLTEINHPSSSPSWTTARDRLRAGTVVRRRRHRGRLPAHAGSHRHEPLRSAVVRWPRTRSWISCPPTRAGSWSDETPS